MEFFKPGRQFDFMGVRWFWIPLSFILVGASVILMFFPGPNYGTDFRGGTEIEVKFTGPVDAAAVRAGVEKAGFKTPDVVQVHDPGNADTHHFIIRVQEVSVLNDATKAALDTSLCEGVDSKTPADDAKCPADARAVEVKFSPGGDKILLHYETEPNIETIAKQVEAGAAGSFTRGPENPRLLQTANKEDFRVEVHLLSAGDQLLEKLRSPSVLGSLVPDHPEKVEWVGPKAGKQLRDSARNSVALAIVFIMLYLAFRFDLRFAPGVVIACIHDAMVVIGVFIALQKEITLSTIAAVLTIVGYSMNDTVVIYDRIRENLSKHRNKTFAQIINMSVSETLSRTILTSGATMLSVLAFFFWGTGVIKDFALAMVVGIIAGTYSSIYVAAPLTEWIDTRMARRTRAARRRLTVGGGSKAAVKA
jgi:preprotein translocase subunit SecF